MNTKLTLCMALLAFSFSGALATNHTVNFGSFFYSPDTLLVTVGDVVTWSGAFASHPLESTSVPNGASSFSNSVGTSYSYSVTVAGTYNYHCSLHGFAGVLIASNPVTPLSGDIVITEFMANPAAVADASGEWFELYNTTSSAIDINAWQVKDNGSDNFTINNSGPLVIQPGAFLVLANNPTTASNGGITPDYAYSGFGLVNSNDAIVLTDGAGVTIDSVAYASSTSGVSWNLSSAHTNSTDNDNFIYWCLSTSPYGSGDLGTPGLLNNDCALTAIEDLASNADLFPNPFSTQLTFSLADNEPATVSLYNFLGQQVWQRTFTNSTTVNTEQMQDGIYFYELRNSKGSLKTGKVVKQ